MNFVVTGGCGYIGSHIILELGKQFPLSHFLIIDDLSSGSVHRYEYLKGFLDVTLIVENLINLEGILNLKPETIVIHCAAKKSVLDSVRNRERYFKNNVYGTEKLLAVIDPQAVVGMVYSSSASVYGTPQYCKPFVEDMPPKPSNPYAETKLLAENRILCWGEQFGIPAVCLRYFNPFGIGDPQLFACGSGLEGSLLGNLLIASQQKRVFYLRGNLEQTSNGFPVRDFLSIGDLARAHLLVANRMVETSSEHDKHTPEIMNVGTGRGVCVDAVVTNYRNLVDPGLQVRVVDMEESEAPYCVADSALFESIYSWQPDPRFLIKQISELKPYAERCFGQLEK